MTIHTEATPAPTSSASGVRRHAKTFSKFTLIGGIFYVLATLGNWLVIDMMQVDALIGGSVVMGALFFAKYGAYRLIDVMNPGFLAYCFGSLGMTLLGIALIWILVDYAELTGALSTALIYGFTYLLRYAAFLKLKIIKH